MQTEFCLASAVPRLYSQNWEGEVKRKGKRKEERGRRKLTVKASVNAEALKKVEVSQTGRRCLQTESQGSRTQNTYFTEQQDLKSGRDCKLDACCGLFNYVKMCSFV